MDNNPMPPLDDEDFIIPDDDQEDFAYLLTIMMKAIDIRIDAGMTYEYLVEMLYYLTETTEGVTEEEAAAFGTKIAMTKTIIHATH
jgi:hypothetical protein